MHHVVLQDLLQALLGQRAVGRLGLASVDLLEERALGVEDQLLDGGDHEDRVLEVEAVLLSMLRLKDALDVRGHPLAEDVTLRPLRGVGGAGWLVALNHQGRFLVEITVGQVAQGAPLDTAPRVLGEGFPHLPQGALDLSKLRLADVAATTHGLAHGVAETRLEAARVHPGAQGLLALRLLADDVALALGRVDDGEQEECCTDRRRQAHGSVNLALPRLFDLKR
mmetsp:Transcript_97359/g.218219  ORF Transcript_97359/g.218219 Transcript_97359/m.218219 type:complete len:224 (+) Transcript_97359:581-1252(+)